MGKVGRPFPKGVSGNPEGRPKLDPAVKAARELTVEEIAKLVEMVFHSTLAELQVIAANPNEEFGRCIVAKCCVVAHRTGDWSKVDSILSRNIGKVPDKHWLSGTDGKPLRPSTPEELRAELEALRLKQGK